jgi:hypothetical protein
VSTSTLPRPEAKLSGVETDEVLETGFGPGTPPGDNILNDYAQGAAAGFGALAAARHERREDDAELDLTLLDGGSPHPFGNAMLTRRPLRDDEWVLAAKRAHDFFGAAPGGPFMCFSAWPTAVVRAHDFGLVGHPPLMYRPRGAVEQTTPDGLRIERVTDEAAAVEWERTMVEGYPAPELQPFRPGCFLPPETLGTPGWHHFVGYLDDRAVATGSAYVTPTHVDGEFISARDEVRGKGIGFALTAAATLAEPSLPAMLIASDAGQPTYERLGYLRFSRYTLWIGHRRGES